MERRKFSLIVVGIAAVAIAAVLHYSERGPVGEPMATQESARSPAPGFAGRSVTGESYVAAVGEAGRATKSNGAHPAGVNTGRGGTSQNGVVGESAMGESVRLGQALSVGGTRRGGGVLSGNESSGGTPSGGSGEAISETGIDSGDAVGRTRPGSQPARPATAPGSGQAPSEQQVAEPGAAPQPPGQNAPQDVMLSVPLHGTTQPDGANQPQPVAEQNIKPSEDGNGEQFPADSVLEFPDAARFINPQAGTLSLDIKPAWDGLNNLDNSFVQVKTPEMWQGQMELYRNGTYLRFVWFDTNQQENDIGVDIRNWQPGEQHSVAATWGEALMSLYVDGQLAGQRTYSGDLAITPGLPMFLGSNPGSHVPGAASTLQNFKVYNRPLTPDEIAAQFTNQNG